MKLKIIYCLTMAALLLTVLTCQKPQAPGPAALTTTPAKSVPEKAAWLERWDKLVEAAKKEGKILIYTVVADETRREVRKALKESFGINVEFIVGRGTELATKLFTERTAGLHMADGISAGSGTQIVTLKPKGILEPLDSLLLLPEVTDPKMWFGGKIPFLDKDHTAIGLLALKNTFLIRNTDSVKEGEIKSFMDLLNSRWKGKITIHDMTITGAANTWGSFMIKDVLGSREKFMDYLKELARNELFITRDTRMVVEVVARGKYAIAIGPNPEITVDFMQVGSPIAVVTAVEGAMITAGAASYSVPKNPAHPNAAQLFLNWLLSKDGATVFSRAMGAPSARVDIEAMGIHPSYKIDLKEKLFLETEEGIVKKADVINIAREIFK